MNDAPCQSAKPLSPFGGVALWQAADALLSELFLVTFDFWACCDHWKPVLERSKNCGLSPRDARRQQGEALCQRVAISEQAEWTMVDDAATLLGLPLAEYGHLHLVAIAEVTSMSPADIQATIELFDARWAAREAAERQRDVQWHKALAAAKRA